MSQSKLITVTLNPSLDRTLKTHYMAVGYKNRTQGDALFHPAGRGVSIARAAHQLGAEAHAIVLIGRDSVGLAYATLLKESGLPHTIVETTAGTRSNTIIYDSGHDTQTELIEERGEVSADELTLVKETMLQIANKDDLILLGGSLSAGIPLDTYYQFATAAQEIGARAAVANIYQPLQETIKAQPEFIALTQQEAESYFNCPVRSVDDVISVSNSLRQETNGRVLIQLADKQRALLTTTNGRWLVDISETDTHGTTTGVWAAMLAGYLTGRISEQPFEEALELGAAAASYTAAQIGSEFGSAAEVQEMTDDVSVEAMKRQKANPTA